MSPPLAWDGVPGNESETRGDWIIDGDLIPLWSEMLASFGVDLIGFIRSNGTARELVRWFTATEDVTFGRRVLGTDVAPLWLSDSGYLKKPEIARRFKRIVRKVLQKDTGQVHIFRRRAALDHRAESIANPLLVEKMFQMSRGLQDAYAISEDLNLAGIQGSFNPLTGEHRPAKGRARPEPDIRSGPPVQPSRQGSSRADRPSPRRGHQIASTPSVSLRKLLGR